MYVCDKGRVGGDNCCGALPFFQDSMPYLMLRQACKHVGDQVSLNGPGCCQKKEFKQVSIDACLASGYVSPFFQEGRKAVPFDVTYSSDMDLLSAQGFANALYHACNVLPGSGSMSAPVCSTFVIVPGA